MRTEWQESCGALLHHIIQMQKGVDSANHLRRAKGRLIQLERLVNKDPIPADEDELRQFVADGALSVYDGLAIGELFYGIQMKKDVGFLIDREYVFADTVMHSLRDARLRGDIDYERVGSKCKSTYRKLR
jgi:hypothetical protein